jgi:hypothetical protein
MNLHTRFGKRGVKTLSRQLFSELYFPLGLGATFGLFFYTESDLADALSQRTVCLLHSYLLQVEEVHY